MEASKGHTVAALAEILRVTPASVRRWISRGLIKAVKASGRYVIPIQANNDFFVARIKENVERPPKPYVPNEIKGYDEWHRTVDELCWLLKVCYALPENVKKRRFRLDALFHSYLTSNSIDPAKVARVFAPPSAYGERLVVSDLKRGWYNELSYAFPLKHSTLGLSFRDIDLNASATDIRFAFPSWKITEAYYGVYFYLRAVVLQKLTGFRLQEHGAAIACFKNSVLAPLSRVLWRFPLNITYVPGQRVYRRDLPLASLPHTRFAYSCHPRAPHSTPIDVFNNIYRVFGKRACAATKPTRYTLFDYLHDFRVWANYLDVDNLLRLWGTGYKGFLDQNLSLITFFVGGVAELCYISVYGPAAYVRHLQELYDLFGANNQELKKQFTRTPLWQRHQILHTMGVVPEKLKIIEEPDVNAVVLP